MRAPGKTMTQEARSAAPSRKKTPPPAAKTDGRARTSASPSSSTIRLPCSCCSRESMRRRWAFWRSCSPKRPRRSRTAAGCTSAPAGGRWRRTSLSFPTPEEHYDYAISQLNTGYYEEAREQFNSILTGASRRRLCVLRAGGAGSDHRPRAGLPRTVWHGPLN